MGDLRIAFYGGSFDPPHNGHLAVADALLNQFRSNINIKGYR